MLRVLILHEIQQFISSLRFQVASVLVALMFIMASLSYVFEYPDSRKSYLELSQKQEAELKSKAEESATGLAISRFSHRLAPRNSAFVASCNENVIPNEIEYSAYNVFGFSTASGKTNRFLLPVDNVNWQFIIIVLISFLAILFSYDSISGEKEDRTLSLCFSNSLSRGYYLIGKYLSINIVLFLFVLTGVMAGTIILLLAPQVMITQKTWVEILLFLLIVVLFTACMTAIGMFASVITYHPNISLLASLTIWLVFMAVIPHSAILLSGQIYPVEKASAHNQRRQQAWNDVEASFPDGKWSSNSSSPFMPKHEIRANMRMAMMESDKRINDEWYNAQFRQYDKTRKLTWFSPFSIMEYSTEVLLDGGFTRFVKNWHDTQNYQTQFLQFFKEFDAKDDESPHWYNPSENYSTTRKPVSFSEVPRYTERQTTIAERMSKIGISLLVLVAYTCLMLFLIMVRFNKYDLR